MTSDTTHVAAALAAARREGTLIDPPAPWPPDGMDTANRIQRAAIDAMCEPVVGWKIGATSPEAQRIIGCNSPFFGPLFASQVHESGSTVPVPTGVLGVECEFAFRMAADQPAGRGGFDSRSIEHLVTSCHPALEIIGRRTRGDGFPGVKEAVADFALNAGFVHGEPIPDWRDADLASAEVSGYVGSERTNVGKGGNVLDHPLNALAWLANTLADRGDGLRAGDWVSTGTCLGVVPAVQGATVAGDYGPLGRVEVTLSNR